MAKTRIQRVPSTENRYPITAAHTQFNIHKPIVIMITPIDIAIITHSGGDFNSLDNHRSLLYNAI